MGFHGEGIVLVAAGEAYYFTDSRYIEAAEKQVAGAAVAVTDRNRNYKAMVQEVIDRCGIKKLGFEEEYMSVAAFHDWKESLTAELVPAQKLVNGLRAAKDQEEIARMVQAQEITDRAFDAILKFIRPGMTEKEIAAKLEYDMLRFGAQRMSFEPIVVTGANGSLPHGIPGDTVVEPGSFLTMDFGCVYGGYCSDMTRTIAVGEPTEEMKKVYHIVACPARASTPPPGRSLRMRAMETISATATATAWASRSTSPPTPTPGRRPSCRWGPPSPPSRASTCRDDSACASRM